MTYKAKRKGSRQRRKMLRNGKASKSRKGKFLMKA